MLRGFFVSATELKERGFKFFKLLVNILGKPIFVVLLYLLCFMLVYSIYCIIVCLSSFSPTIDKILYL